MMKQDLKSKTEKLKYQKKIIEIRKINKLFYNKGVNHHSQKYSI